MIVEHLINVALMSKRLVVEETRPGAFALKVKIGGAALVLARVSVVMEEKPSEPIAVEAPAETPPVDESATVLAFPGARK